jgi:hypothetical protein
MAMLGFFSMLGIEPKKIPKKATGQLDEADLEDLRFGVDSTSDIYLHLKYSVVALNSYTWFNNDMQP